KRSSSSALAKAIEQRRTLPALMRLADRALVRCSPDGRYDLHELLRQYGEEKLHHSPSKATEMRQRHADYFTSFLQQRLEQLHGPDQRQAFREINAELQNVRAAWRWAVSQADEGAIHRAATTYFLYCQQKCTYLEGANALAQAAASLDGQPSTPQRDRVLAQLHNHEGWLRIRVGEFRRAKLLFERSRSLYKRLGAPPPPHMGGASEAGLALVAVIQGDVERALKLAESARRGSEQREDQHNLAFAHYALSTAKLAEGDYEEAQKHAQKSTALARSLGNRWFLAYPLNEWGKAALALEDRAEAKHHFQASYAIKREFNDAEGMAVALNHLGEIARLQGSFSEARDAFERSLGIYRTLNDRGGLATSYRGLAKVALSLDEIGEARKYLNEALKIATDIDYLPLIFSLLVDVEPVLQQQGRAELAVSLLSLVRHHPASDHEATTKADLRLQHCRQQMPAQDFADALQQGKSLGLESAINALRGSLAAPLDATDLQASTDQNLIEPLTAREQEVLALLAEGHTNAQIAEELVLAMGTVKWYASQIYGKLGVTNRTEAAARAWELELL
ncbi:MAG: tetratricopeptide repeat protein, partial [Anaerolineales bacterium]